MNASLHSTAVVRMQQQHPFHGREEPAETPFPNGSKRCRRPTAVGLPAARSPVRCIVNRRQGKPVSISGADQACMQLVFEVVHRYPLSRPSRDPIGEFTLYLTLHAPCTTPRYCTGYNSRPYRVTTPIGSRPIRPCQGKTL